MSAPCLSVMLIISVIVAYIDGISINAKKATNAIDTAINTNPTITSLRLFVISVLVIFEPISIATPEININAIKPTMPTTSPLPKYKYFGYFLSA